MKEKELYERLRGGDGYAHSRLRYSLARELTPLFYHPIPGTKEVYIYGSTVSDRAHLFSDGDLLILVDKKEALAVLVLEEVDDDLCQKYTSYFGIEEKGLKKLLNVTLIDEVLLKHRRGLSVHIHSPFTPVLRIPNTG